MDMAIAGEPAARRHVDPAVQFEFHRERFGSDDDLLCERMIFLAAFRREGVAPRRQLHAK